jgi:hypothetical protein
VQPSSAGRGVTRRSRRSSAKQDMVGFGFPEAFADGFLTLQAEADGQPTRYRRDGCSLRLRPWRQG